jgi:hypothetical protein
VATFDGLIRPVSYFKHRDLAAASSEDWSQTSKATSWTQLQPQPLVLGGGPPQVLFMGDSDMQQYYPRIEKLLGGGQGQLRSAVFMTHFGCVPGSEAVPAPASADCRSYIHDVVEYAGRQNIDTVVIAGCWYGYFSAFVNFRDFGKRAPLKPYTQKALHSLRATLESFVRSGKRVYIVLNIPVGAGLDPRARAYWYGTDPAVAGKADVAAALESIDSKLREMAGEVGATVIDPLEYLCAGAQCPAVSGDRKSMYRDLWHLRPSYVRDEVTYLDGILSRSLN